MKGGREKVREKETEKKKRALGLSLQKVLI